MANLEPVPPEILAMAKPILDKIVQAVKPVRVILSKDTFLGGDSPDGKYQFHVVVSDGTPWMDASEAIYRSLFKAHLPAKVWVITEEKSSRKRKHLPFWINEGNVIYETV